MTILAVSESKTEPVEIRGPQVEATNVKFEVEIAGKDGVAKKKIVSLPASYGQFHDPSGTRFPSCRVYFGPWRRTNRPAKMNLTQRRYFGGDHKAKVAIIPSIPVSGWKVIGRVTKIFYKRRGVRAPYGFHHGYSSSSNVTLSKSGKIYEINLGVCLVDGRGFVWP